MRSGKLFLATFVATLGASFMHQASAQWSTGGAVSVPRKSHLAGFDLFCDLTRKTFPGLADVAGVKINTLPSAANPGAAPALTLSGEMFCAEVLSGHTGLENAQSGLIGRFQLIQRSPAKLPDSPPKPTLTQEDTGLHYAGPDANGIRTWTFKVPPGPVDNTTNPPTELPTEQFPFPELLYDLEPADLDTAVKFCAPAPSQFPNDNCKVLIGLQLRANEKDYPARSVDEQEPGNDLAKGEVFKFATKTTGTTEAPGKFFWGPCHSQAFARPQSVVVDAKVNGSHQNGVLRPGAGKSTGFTPAAFGARIAVTVNQNDLWNFGQTIWWSNADGLVRVMTATGRDDSQAPAGTQIGVDFPSELSGDLRKWNPTTRVWDITESAPFGSLVGTFGENESTFYVFGTAFDGPAPATGELKLWAWTSNANDNLEFLTVTVANESIQCKVIDANGTPTEANASTEGLVYGGRKIEVEGFPTLSVQGGSNPKVTKAAFPFSVLGCNQGDAAITFVNKSGSPIVLGNNVLINNQTVGILSSGLEDKVQRTSCDGGSSLADLTLQLSKSDVIKALAPNGVCQNGPTRYYVRVGQGTFYLGEDTVELTDCQSQ